VSFRLGENPYLETVRALSVIDGALSFSTSLYHGLSRAQSGFRSLCHGLWHPLHNRSFVRETRAYLDPMHLWNNDRYVLEVRLKPDEEPWETIRLAINEYAGLAADCDLNQAVNQTPIARLPRWLTVLVPLRMEPVSLGCYPVHWNHRIRMHPVTV